MTELQHDYYKMYFCIVNDTTCDLALRYVLLRQLVRIASSSPSIDMMLISWCQLQQFWDSCPYKFNKLLGGDSSNRYFWLQLLTAWIFFLPGKWFVIGALFVPCDTVATSKSVLVALRHGWKRIGLPQQAARDFLTPTTHLFLLQVHKGIRDKHLFVYTLKCLKAYSRTAAHDEPN